MRICIHLFVVVCLCWDVLTCACVEMRVYLIVCLCWDALVCACVCICVCVCVCALVFVLGGVHICPCHSKPECVTPCTSLSWAVHGACATPLKPRMVTPQGDRLYVGFEDKLVRECRLPMMKFSPDKKVVDFPAPVRGLAVSGSLLACVSEFCGAFSLSLSLSLLVGVAACLRCCCPPHPRWCVQRSHRQGGQPY
mgnify:CR=1 FL=1